MSDGVLRQSDLESTTASALLVPVNRWLAHGLHAGLSAAGLVVLLSYGILAVGHLKDRYQVDIPSGVYAALAAHLNEGTFYPELYDGARYGGTRYMPLYFVLHAGVARLTGEYLLSGKLLTYALTVLLSLELIVLLLRQQSRFGIGLALLSLVFVSRTGFLACLTIRGDLLPVVCQLAALMLVEQNQSVRRTVFAGLLCTLALLAKMSAGWGAVAISWYLLTRQRRSCALFLATWLGSLLLALGALHLVTSGRMLANFQMFSGSGIEGAGPLLAPIVLLYRLSFNGPLFGLVVPLLALECVLAVRERRLTIYHRALFCCLPVLLVIYGDVGADHNHLLDLIVLAVPVLSCLWGRLVQAGAATAGLRSVLAVGLCWVLFMSWTDLMDNAVREVVLGRGQAGRRYPAKPLAGLVPDDARILSDDPWMDLARGHTPWVLDPFSISRMIRTCPQRTANLIRGVQTGSIERIVLTRRVDQSNSLDRNAWEDMIFGRPVVDAIRNHYHLAAQAEGYFLYVPNAHPAETAQPRHEPVRPDPSRS
jgi:hypothetical protein